MLYRVCLYLDDQKFRTKLREKLTGDNIALTNLSTSSKGNILNTLGKQNCDMLVTSLGLLPENLKNTIEAIKMLPDTPAIVLMTESDIASERAAYMAMGCDAVLNSNIPITQIADAITGIIDNRLEFQSEILKEQFFQNGPSLADFVSSSPAMQTFMDVVKKVVKSDSSLLITGETGVGKERMARAIHSESLRAEGPFIPINCAALPENLLESEIFGHEQGAFTGATRARRGAFEIAHQGTIFLDEIGDMPLKLQVKILRVLQEKSFTRVGGEKPINVDVRIMAATNQDLKMAIDNNYFRKDLYFRLSVITLCIPPLRERGEDIRELVTSYIPYLNSRIGTEVNEITEEAMSALEHYEWPGNVRELINVIERAMLLCDNNKITISDLPEEISHKDMMINDMLSLYSSGDGGYSIPDHWKKMPWKDVRKEVLDFYEKAYIVSLLNENSGKINQTAKIAGINVRSIYDKMRYHNIRKEIFKS